MRRDLHELKELAHLFREVSARTNTAGWNFQTVNGKQLNLHSLPHLVVTSDHPRGRSHDFFLTEDGAVWECRYHEHLFSSKVDREWTRYELDAPHVQTIIGFLKDAIDGMLVRS